MTGDESQGQSLEARTQAFLSEFFAQGEQLVRDLIVENERLRVSLNERDLPKESTETTELVRRLNRQIAELEAECADIRRLAGSVQQESGGYRKRLDSLEREHYHLAAMYVAGNQFHTANTVDEVLRTITEVLLNFVGVGRFTLFCVDEERQVLFPLAREGGDVAECAEFTLVASQPEDSHPPPPMRQALDSGRPWRSGQPRGRGDGALMHLPLCSGTRLIGVARIESFLPQKAEFVDNDDGMLELISEHSGIGIETAWIRAHAREVPLARRGLEELVVA